MLLHQGVRALAAAATAATIAIAQSPAMASGSRDEDGSRGLYPATAQHPPRHYFDSTDWETLAIAAGGIAVLIGAGLLGSGRLTRRYASTGALRAPRVDYLPPSPAAGATNGHPR